MSPSLHGHCRDAPHPVGVLDVDLRGAGLLRRHPAFLAHTCHLRAIRGVTQVRSMLPAFV